MAVIKVAFQEPKGTWKPKPERAKGNYPHSIFSLKDLRVSLKDLPVSKWLYPICASCSLLLTGSLFGLQGIMIQSLGVTVCVMPHIKDCWGLGLTWMETSARGLVCPFLFILT